MRLKKMGWIISLIFVMLIGCGKSTEQQITEQLSLGQKYLEEANYEEAIIAFNKIIELDPLVAEAYMGIAQCYESQSDYEESLNILDEGVQVIGRDMLPEETIERIAEIYSRLSERFSQQGNTELLLRCYSAIMQLQPDNEEIKEKEEEIRMIQEKRSRLEEMAYSIVEEDVYDFQDMEILSEDFQALIAGLEKPVIFAVEEGRYLGVYPGGYIYYGEMEDGKRSGNGYWYYGNMKRITKIQGNWKDDMLNGNTVSETYVNPAEIEREEGRSYAIRTTYSGQTEKGICVGTWNVSWIMESGHKHEWKVSYLDGIAQKIGINNKGRNIYAYCEKCGSDLSLGDEVQQLGEYN